jgi:hypothetical protein
MATTTNFGWTTPNDTDYVTQGAAAMRTLGNGIDTTLVDLKGGTTDQVLAKNSNTDMDFKWVENGEVLLSTTTLSGTDTLISSISQSYKQLTIVVQNIDLPSSGADVTINFQKNGTSYAADTITTVYRDTSGTRYAAQDPTFLPVGFDDLKNAFTFIIRDYASTTANKPFTFYGGFNRNVSGVATQASINGYGVVQNNDNVNQIRFRCATGTGFAGGTVRIYGVN